MAPGLGMRFPPLFPLQDEISIWVELSRGLYCDHSHYELIYATVLLCPKDILPAVVHHSWLSQFPPNLHPCSPMSTKSWEEEHDIAVPLGAWWGQGISGKIIGLPP